MHIALSVQQAYARSYQVISRRGYALGHSWVARHLLRERRDLGCVGSPLSRCFADNLFLVIVNRVYANRAAVDSSFGIAEGSYDQCSKDDHRGNSIAHDKQHRRSPRGRLADGGAHVRLKLTRLQTFFIHSVLDDEVKIGFGTEFGRAARTSLKVRAPLGGFDVPAQVSIGDLLVIATIHHLAFAFMYLASRFAKSSLTSVRDRDRRDITVPIGIL